MLFLLGWAVTYAVAQPAHKLLTATGKEFHAQALSHGTWTCEGGTPTGQMPPCSPGTKKIFARGVSSRLRYADLTGSGAAMLDGENITHVNAILDENYYGHLSCTFEWTVPAMGGRWDGTCSAIGYPLRRIVFNKAVAHGHGGQLEGLKLEFYSVTLDGVPGSTFVAVVKDERPGVDFDSKVENPRK